MKANEYNYVVYEELTFQGIFSKLGTVLKTWRNRINERRQLAEMSPYQIKDSGITSLEARKEIQKPFWC